ncbi:translation initiation factor IF-2 [Eubacterium ruminantium]|uniref:Translation initiation factor IF-2 n=1 Tax=Eubacterium ruminantium TaxID=42322 RepID=A0A1T4MEE5_9FIRM|nr:translation initiation factor IF-2 [Eubacterium ruminantium]SJZ65440.1 bacterial translation initiation factor 2 (bIF-2) [Eubacterium ruminantium]
MRVYEFAKQLTGETGKAISSNDVLQLVGNKKEGLKASSGIDDELMAYVRNILNAKNTQAKPAAADNANEKSVKSEEKTPVKTDNNDSQNGNAAARQSGDRPVRDGDRPRRDGDRPVRDGLRMYGDRPRRDGDRPVRDGDRPRRDGDRPVRDGDRPRRDGDRPVRDGDRPRRDGDRPIRRDGDRPRRDGDRPIRRDGDRPVRDGDRPRRDGDRPRRDGDRPIRRDGDRSSGGMRDNRDRNRDRMGRDRDHDKDMFDKDSDRDVRDRGRDNRRERDNRDVDRDQHSRRESEKRDRESRRDREKYDKEKRDRESMRPEITRKSQSHKDSHKDVKKEPVKQEPAEPVIKNVILPEVLTVKELADKLKQPVNAMIKKLFLEGKIVTVNTELSFESAAEIALEYNYIADEEEKVDIIEELLKDEEDPEDSLSPRPPVVCVMGHVDHGKTSLLDAIRKTQVTADEAGGITQHIGAYVVKANDQRITFLDTPGHEAFTAMRMRGAQSTDIAILVVAADDGVMPQTVEAINHAKAAGIEIIVAVNKIDKESANVERVKQELTEYGLIAEDWGGSTIFCPVSAHTREGLDNLLDMILLTADMLELKANKNRLARGLVIEARLDKGRGPVATLLVQKGTLKVGDHIAIGEVSGRVRAMLDHKQRRLKEATPSTPVEIIGLNGVPNSGDIFLATKSEKEAREITDAFKTRGKENLILDTKRGMSLDDLFNKMQEGTVKELDLIIKADVQGSVEAVKQSLLKLSNEEIVIKCIHSGVGAINESDVTLAAASNAIIIGFNIRPDAQAKSLADQEKVDVRLYRVIYNAIDDIESAMKGMLDPIFEEKIIGHVEVRQTYKASGIGTIAGSYVLDGLVQRGCSARITRDGEQIFDGKLASLKRFKDDVKEVKAGYECGLVFEDFNDIKVDDQIECYAMVEVPR